MNPRPTPHVPTTMRPTLAILGSIALIIGFGLAALEWRRYFEPEHAAVGREVFEQTPSFVHGKAQYIARLRLQYEAADTDASRQSLRTLIKSEAAAVDTTLLPRDIQAFLATL